jgi:hypothetical protein
MHPVILVSTITLLAIAESSGQLPCLKFLVVDVFYVLRPFSFFKLVRGRLQIQTATFNDLLPAGILFQKLGLIDETYVYTYVSEGQVPWNEGERFH